MGEGSRNKSRSQTTVMPVARRGGGGDAQARFGMWGGVFTPCVLTILGVIMFMRTGFVVGHSGLYLALAILVISKSITTLTTLSLSAIATNTKIKGGGVYYMISRVLGPDFGGAIGITLYVAQAVAVAFYAIGFTEALFDVLTPILSQITIGDITAAEAARTFKAPQIIATATVAGTFALSFRGADVAIKVQYVVLGILLLSVTSFLLGGAMRFDTEVLAHNTGPSFSGGITFWLAFAIFFPATTGIAAGANMSGDLKDPAKSLPSGTLLAIGFTAVIYVAQVVLTAGAMPADQLKGNSFVALQVMSVAGPLVILGVFAATLSSALGSFLGAPRILQAMGKDRLLSVLSFFGKGSGATNEPRRATILTLIIAVAVIWAGDLNAVAEVISMFFLIAYGMINLSAFVESRSANPTFRPTFKYFHWSLALAGAIGCAIAMVKINETYALAAFAIAAIVYFYLRKKDIQTSWGDAKRGYIFKSTRDNLMYLEQNPTHPKNWRPILVGVTNDPMRDRQMLRVGSWMESQRGLYTVTHIATRAEEERADLLRTARRAREDLRRQLEADEIVAFHEVVCVDDYHEGLFVFLQSYSIGGLRPNSVLLSMPPKAETERREQFLDAVDVLTDFDLNLVILKPGDIAPRRKVRTIDMWWRGYQNGSLMALFAYLMTLDDAWSGARIRIMRIVRSDREENDAIEELGDLVQNARMNAKVQVIRSDRSPLEIIAERSGPKADLVLMGMAAASGEEFRKYLEVMDPVLERLPTTVLVSSNGEADVFV